jgi:NADH-quinone oxidoreductase subunit N
VNFNQPHIDYAGISPLIALTVGICVVLLSAVFKPTKRWAPGLTTIALAATAGLLIWQWNDPKTLITGALRLDDLAISISLIAILTAAFCVVLSLRERATEEAGSGEYHSL